MKPRERFRKAFAFEEADRVPLDMGALVSTVEREAYNNLKTRLGVEKKTEVFSRDHVFIPEEILQRFNIDTRYVHFSGPKTPDGSNGPDRDEWGITWQKNESSLYFEPVKGPFYDADSKDNLEGFDWPNEISRAKTKRWASRAKELYKNTDCAVIGDFTGLGIFEQASQMRGFERFLLDLAKNPEFADALLNKVVETQISRFREWLDAIGDYVEAVWVSDDLGMQDRPLLSPAQFKNLLKPKYKRLYGFIKQQHPVKLIHHSDGAITPFLDDLIEVGVDAINPIQVSAEGMDPAKLKRDYGERLVFWGGSCDSQSTLPGGTREEVREEVKKRVMDFKPGGGYVFSSIHNIQPDTPPENIVALFDSAIEFGGY